MGPKGLRNASRRLVIELAVVVALVSFPIEFPRSTSTGRAWSFIAHNPLVLAHIAVASLIAGEAIALLVRAISGANRGRRAPAVSTIGLAFIVLAYASGLTFTATGQHESALTSMSLGWLGALVTYVTGWVMGHRAVAAERRATATR